MKSRKNEIESAYKSSNISDKYKLISKLLEEIENKSTEEFEKILSKYQEDSKIDDETIQILKKLITK